MKRQRSRVVLAATILLTVLFSSATRLKAAEDDNRSAELKVLDRWVGDWDMEATIKPNAFMPQGSKSTYKATIRWTVNGRFLRCDAEGDGAQGDRKFKDAFSWICTFDPRAKTYISTVFWANVGGGADDRGGGLRGTGKWDDTTKTLATRTLDPDTGVSSTGVTTWTDADHHEFVSTMTDGNGKVIMEMSGKATRRK